MAIANNAHRIMDLTDVLGTVHAAIASNFEEYATNMDAGQFGDALANLQHQHGLTQQAQFLLTELSAAHNDEAEPAVDPDQLELRITVTDGVTTMDATPAAQTHVGAGRAVAGLMRTNEREVLEAVADRIAGNASPDEDSRLEVAYAIARHLKLDWPSAQLPPAEKERAREDVRDPIHVVANNVSYDLANMAFGNDWIYATGAEGVDAAAVFTAEHVAKRIADKPLSQVESLPRGGESIHQFDLPTGLVESPMPVADTEAAARVCGSLVTFFETQGQAEEAVTLANAEEILLRGSGGAAAVRRAIEPQTFPAVAAGDMALFDNFAVNPDTDPQLIVGLLGTDNVLVWQMAGTVPEGAFTTLRQRLQMFADTTDCVALARVRA